MPMKPISQKHCPTCTCGQRGIRPNSLYIKQHIESGSMNFQERDTVVAMLKLMGHSQTTIREALSASNDLTPTLTPRSSVSLPKTSFEKRKCTAATSLDITREEDTTICDYCKSKAYANAELPPLDPTFVTICDRIQVNPNEVDAVHVSPTTTVDQKCWQRFCCS